MDLPGTGMVTADDDAVGVEGNGGVSMSMME
jgi:hypothetical protein